jgi:hypothetical protein
MPIFVGRQKSNFLDLIKPDFAAILLALCYISAVLCVVSFLSERTTSLLSLSILYFDFNLTLPGLFALLSIFTYGWYLSEKYSKSFTWLKHVRFALAFSVYTVMICYIAFFLFKIIEGSQHPVFR